MISACGRQSERPGAALERSERLRYAQVNRELRHLRMRLRIRRITEAEYAAEAKVLMESLEGWAPSASTTHPHLEAERRRFAGIQQELRDLEQQRNDGRISAVEFHKRAGVLIKAGSDVTPADATPTHPAVYSRDYRPRGTNAPPLG